MGIWRVQDRSKQASDSSGLCLQQSRFFDGHATVFDLAADLKFSLAREEFAKYLANRPIVIDYQH